MQTYILQSFILLLQFGVSGGQVLLHLIQFVLNGLDFLLQRADLFLRLDGWRQRYRISVCRAKRLPLWKFNFGRSQETYLLSLLVGLLGAGLSRFGSFHCLIVGLETENSLISLVRIAVGSVTVWPAFFAHSVASDWPALLQAPRFTAHLRFPFRHAWPASSS